MYGSHLSVAGGLHLALLEAQRLEMDCVQIFTKNQRQWAAKPLTDEQITTWRDHQSSTGVKHVVSHDSYLINLASPDPTNLAKSMDLFRDELLRCEALGIPELVTHPGAHMGTGEEVGLRRVIESLDELHAQTPGLSVVTCVETTAGQGTSLGWRFEHIRTILEGVKAPERLAVCFDTAHLLESGYDLTSAQGAAGILEEADASFGLERVRVIHVNDSKTARGSRVDRHDHIGAGHVSLDAFATFLNHPALRDRPKVLETPKEASPDGRPWDTVNIERLKSLRRPGQSRRVPTPG